MRRLIKAALFAMFFISFLYWLSGYLGSFGLSGMIKAKRIKERVVSERTELYPITEGYSEVTDYV